jgi:putative hydrolase of the HAD superfamily
MVRGILFDLDGTLFDRESTVRELLQEQHQQFRSALGKVSSGIYVARMLELDAHGHGDKGAAYQRAAIEFDLPEDLAVNLVADFWSRYHSLCRCFPEVLPVLAELRDHGLKLGIVTNGAVRIQEPAIQRLGLASLMNSIHISEREGVRKPAPEIFARAVRALEVDREETWHVGDHPEVDVRGAVDAGLTAICRRTSHWPEPNAPHEAIQDLRELLPWVRAECTGGV